MSTSNTSGVTCVTKVEVDGTEDFFEIRREAWSTVIVDHRHVIGDEYEEVRYVRGSDISEQVLHAHLEMELSARAGRSIAN